MKAIFVDIDGVFLPQRAAFLPGQDLSGPKVMAEGEGDPSWPKDWLGRRWKPISRKLDPVAVSLLARLVELSGARVVASTNWRYKQGAGKDVIEKAFLEAGFDIAAAWHEDWATVSTRNDVRLREVGDWLDRHPEVLRWVAFEDDHRLPAPGAIYVSATDGLSLDNYRKALLLLDVLDKAFGVGGGWPNWTEWGERDAIRRWLDHAYASRHRIRNYMQNRTDTSRMLHQVLEEIEGSADADAEEAMKQNDPWTAEGGPAPFLEDPASIELRIPELREKDEELRDLLSMFGYASAAEITRKRPGAAE